MALGGNKMYAVRVTYRDGSSALLGPVRSRQEARRLAGASGGPGSTARVFRWTGTEQSTGGVISRRPAPTPPPVEPEEPEEPNEGPSIDNWDLWQNDYEANEVVLIGSGFTGATDVEVISAVDSQVVPGTSFTVEDDGHIVIHWPSGEVIPTEGWTVTTPEGSDNLEAHWALGVSFDSNAGVWLNPTAQAAGVGFIEITDANGTGNFANSWDKVELYGTNNAYYAYEPSDNEWTNIGGNTIGITDPALEGETITHIQMHMPQGFIVANSGSNLSIEIPAGPPATPVIENVTIPENSGELHLIGQNLNPQGLAALGLYVAGDFENFPITEDFVLSVSDEEIVIDQAGFEAFSGAPSQSGFYEILWRDENDSVMFDVQLPGAFSGMQIGTSVVVSSDGISYRFANSPSSGVLRVQGWGMSLVQNLTVYWDNDSQSASDTPPFDNPPDNGYLDTSVVPSGETVSRIEFRNGSNDGPTATGLSIPVQ